MELKKLEYIETEKETKWSYFSGQIEISNLTSEDYKKLNLDEIPSAFLLHESIERPLYLEYYECNLEKFIQLLKNEEKGSLQTLTRICIQVVQTVEWLHSQGITMNRKLNPRAIYIQNSKDEMQNSRYDKCKIIIPELANPGLDNICAEDDDYLHAWIPIAENRPLEIDSFAICCIFYFVITLGHHPFSFENPEDMDQEDYADIRKNIGQPKKGSWLIKLAKKCCNKKHSDDLFGLRKECYRFWREKLLLDIIKPKLLRDEDLHIGDMLRHPFFWNSRKILGFVHQIVSHAEGNEKLKKELTLKTMPWKSELKGDFKKFMLTNTNDVSQSKKADSKKSMQNSRNDDGEEIDEIRDTMFSLIKIIRNKSVHWYQHSIPQQGASKQAANYYGQLRKKTINELEKMDFGNQELKTYPDKYCFFWMTCFDDLLLQSWKAFRETTPKNVHNCDVLEFVI